MACPACHLFPETCLVCGAVVTRLARAVGPLAPEHAGTIVDELQRLVVDAERVTADIEAARRDGEEAGRLAAIRAEVAYAIADMDREAQKAAREEWNWRYILKPRSGLDPFNRAQFVGLRSIAERKRLRAFGFLEASRRWLEATR